MVWNTILARAKANGARIAVGVGETYREKTVKSAERAAAEGYASVTFVSAHAWIQRSKRWSQKSRNRP